MSVRRSAAPKTDALVQDHGAAATPTVRLSPETDGPRDARDGRDDAKDDTGGVMTMPAALLTALYTHLPAGLIVVDTAGRVVFTNEAGARLSAEVVRATAPVGSARLSDRAIAPSLLPHWTLIVRVLAGFAVPDVDYVLERQGERQQRIVEVSIRALYTRSEQITGAVLTLTDQTERVGGQAMLARAANRLAEDARTALARTAATLAEEAVTQAQDNRDLTRSNTALEVQAALARAANRLAEDARTALARTAATLAEEAVTQAQDNRDLTRSNTEGEERFRLLVGSVRDCALLMLDPQGHVISWNEGAQRITQYTTAEIVGQHVSGFYTLTEREQDVPAQDLRRCAAQGHAAAEGWRVRKDGSRFWAEVRLTAIYDAQDHLIGFGQVARDLTEPRRVDEEIRHLNASLEQRVTARTTDLDTANRQLRAINQELEAFAYSVSHDLRTPLRAISGFGDILLTSYSAVLDARGLHYLERIRTATTQMGQLIDDLLALSRLTRAEMHSGLVDLTGLARGVAATLQQADPERVVTWDIAEGLTAHGDAALLRVMLDNLLGNAWKFTSQHPMARIAVGMRQEEGDTIYVVRDDGAGFDMAYADKLFGAFQRLHTTREFAGTGIGLATVQRIIHRHGGRVWAQGAVEHGATISFTLAAPEGGQHAA